MKPSHQANPAEQLPRMETCKDMYETAWLLPSTLHLEAARPGAAAHMSLHLNQQCQRASETDAPSLPFFSGRPVRLNFGDRRCVPVRSTASVEWLLCGSPPPVNTVLQFCVFWRGTPPETLRKPPFLRPHGGGSHDHFMTYVRRITPNHPRIRG